MNGTASRGRVDYLFDHPGNGFLSRQAYEDENKEATTIQSLLDTSGRRRRDETIMRIYRSPDRTEFVLSQPMSGIPPATFYYDSGNPDVLSVLITKKPGQSAFDFAEKA